ncbi:MAG TPA: hemolysin family protein, partial [Actinomycetales bacterium]|nr:hemolysin family protein [Actinomycetales bacterium]
MSDILTNAALVLLFVLIGGVFSASEIALVSLRASQIEGLAQRGGRGLRVARLAANSNRFLSAVQVGVTLAGFFSASYGAATIAPRLAPALESRGVPAAAAGTIAFIGTTLVIAYLSLVLGELAPKRLALQRAEGLSLLVAAPLDVLASIMRPVIWLLSKSTDVVVRLLGGDPNAQREEMGEEELRSIVRGHQALTAEERRIVTEALEIGDRRVEQVMLPRTEVSFLRADTLVDEAVSEVRDKPHSRYPVVADSLDDIVGFVHVRDLFDPLLQGRNALVRDLVREVQLLPESVRVLTALTRMRATNTHLAIVVDEYGGTAGIVTLEDILEELVGEIRDEYDPRVVSPANLPPGAVDVDGLLQVEDIHELVPGLEIPDGPYETIGGFVMHRLGRMPLVGDTVSLDEHLITVS